MKNFMRTLGALLAQKAAEKTTWAGALALVTALGIYLSPEDIALITSIGTAVAGAVLVKMRDPA